MSRVNTRSVRGALIVATTASLMFPASLALATPETTPPPETTPDDKVDAEVNSSTPAQRPASPAPPPPDTSDSPATDTPAPESPEDGDTESPGDGDTDPDGESPQEPQDVELQCPVTEGLADPLRPGDQTDIDVTAEEPVGPLRITTAQPTVGKAVSVDGNTVTYVAPETTQEKDVYIHIEAQAGEATGSCDPTVRIAPAPPSSQPTESTTGPSDGDSPSEPEEPEDPPTATETSTQTVTSPAPTRTPSDPPVTNGDGNGAENESSNGGSGGNGEVPPQYGPFESYTPSAEAEEGRGNDNPEDIHSGDAETNDAVTVTATPTAETDPDRADEGQRPDATNTEASGYTDPDRFTAPAWLAPTGIIAILLLIAGGIYMWRARRNNNGGNHRI